MSTPPAGAPRPARTRSRTTRSANLLRQAGESRALLGKHLDLYQIHSATLESRVLDDASVLGELARLKGDGLRIGLSLSGPRQAEAIRKAIEARSTASRSSTPCRRRGTCSSRSIGPALAEAHALGMGVIVKEALANGRLTSRNDDPSFAERRRVLESEANRLGTTLDAIALAAVMARPWADVVLSGAATTDQLRSNLGALAVAWDSEAEGRLDPIAETTEAYWAARARLPWN